MAWTPLEKGENNFDVLIIGAGVSGINFAYRIQERCPELSYAVLENRHEMGGTWSLFNYPGIRSDSDLYTFGFSWRPWQHKTAIAEGALIKSYVKDCAAEFGIDKHIKYHHHVNASSWSSKEHAWTLDVTANKTEKKTFKSRWILLCTGYYDYETPLETTITGLNNFKGQILHPQFWPESFDYTDKDVVIIGSGATAITVLPIMSEKASHVTMLQRSPSYIMSLPREDPIEKTIRFLFSWAPAFRDLLLRWKWILIPLFSVWHATHFPEMARHIYCWLAEIQLPKSVPRDPHFTPKYTPWQQRLCVAPDGDFYKCLRKGRASIETGVIETVTKDGIKLQSGKELHPDVIVTATGLKLRFAGGMKFSVDGKPYNYKDHFAWKGVMLQDLPNLSFVIGYVDASWTLGADATAQLVTRMYSDMKKEGVVEVRPEMSKDDENKVEQAKMLRLNSTYIERAKDVIPKVGDRGQWVARTHFIRDILTAWYGDIHSEAQWVKA